MTTNDIPAIRADHRSFDQAATDSRRVDARPILALGLAGRVPGLCDEVEQLRATLATRDAEVGQLRSERDVVERLVMDTVVATPLPADADQVIAGRPALPYRSITVDGLFGMDVAEVDGQVVIDGLAHTPAAALELSAAIARAARETTTTGGRCG